MYCKNKIWSQTRNYDDLTVITNTRVDAHRTCSTVAYTLRVHEFPVIIHEQIFLLSSYIYSFYITFNRSWAFTQEKNLWKIAPCMAMESICVGTAICINNSSLILNILRRMYASWVRSLNWCVVNVAADQQYFQFQMRNQTPAFCWFFILIFSLRSIVRWKVEHSRQRQLESVRQCSQHQYGVWLKIAVEIIPNGWRIWGKKLRYLMMFSFIFLFLGHFQK